MQIKTELDKHVNKINKGVLGFDKFGRTSMFLMSVATLHHLHDGLSLNTDKMTVRS